MTETKELLQNNLKHWSQYASEEEVKLIAETKCDNVSFTFNPDGNLNLLVKTEKGVDPYHFNDINLETNKQRGQLNSKSAKVLYVYGIGLGYFYPKINDWLKEDPKRLLIFLEDNPEILHRFFQTEFAEKIMNDKQVRIHYLDPNDTTYKILDMLTSILVNEEYVFSVSLYNWLHKKEAMNRFQATISYLSSSKPLFLNELFGMEYGQFYFRNFYPNLRYLPKAYLADRLEGKFNGIPAIICGAGPSLKKNINVLSKLTDRALIFAGGTAINAINSLGVQPHFTVGIDPNATHVSRTISNNAFETPFLFRNRIFPECLDIIQDNHVFVTGGYKIGEWVEKNLDIKQAKGIEEGYNVICVSVSLARMMGCNPIVMVGVDLAYTDNISYVEGLEFHPIYSKQSTRTKSLNEELIVRPDVDGKPTTTVWKWVTESNWYGDYAKKFPDFLLLNATEGGIGLGSIPNMPLSRVALLFMNNQYDLDTMIHGALQNAHMPAKVTYDNLLKVLDELKGSLVRCEEHFHNLEKKYTDCLTTIFNDPEAVLPAEAENLDSIKKEPAYEYILQTIHDTYNQYNGMKHKYFNIIPASEKVNDARYRLNLFTFLNKAAIRNREFLQNGEEQIKKFQAKHIETKDTPAADRNEVIHGDFGTKKTESYPSGAIKSETFYQDNLLNGPSVFYAEDGNVLAKAWYNRGLKEGKAYGYYLSGALFSLGNYKSGQKEGKQEYFNEDGSTRTILNYKNGQLHGKALLYYPNGKLKREINYQYGFRDGKESLWNEEGNLLIEAEYVNGKPAGTSSLWATPGKLAKQITYNEGSSDPDVQYFAQNGQLIPKIFYESEDYFDYMLHETTKFTKALNEIHSQVQSFSSDVANLKDEVRSDISQALVTLKAEINRIQNINDKIKDDFFTDKSKEKIWKSLQLQRIMQHKLDGYMKQMGADIKNIFEMFNQLKIIVSKNKK